MKKVVEVVAVATGKKYLCMTGRDPRISAAIAACKGTSWDDPRCAELYAVQDLVYREAWGNYRRAQDALNKETTQ